MKYIDLSHRFDNNMPVFPGDGKPELLEATTVLKDGFSHFELKTNFHVGTHIDAPSHMVADGKFLSDYPASRFFGKGIVIDARGVSQAGVELLQNKKIKKNDIVLFCFNWSKAFRDDEYYLNYPIIKKDLATKLADLEVSIVGMDTPSPDKSPYEVHKILFQRDILIIENLTNLETLFNSEFEIIALPTAFQAEAGFCRVVAKIL